MRTDLSNWNSLTVTEVSNIFSSIPISWGIAGGWALDIHLGRKTRKHSDMDIVIFREDQQVMYRHLKNEWTLYKAKDGELSPWKEKEYLDAINDVWVSRDIHSSWAFQIMLMDCDQDNWIYRREKTIKVPKEELFYSDENNVPYLKPAIQLLYKGGSSQTREKDFRDFQSVLPSLSLKEKEWLKEALKRQFPLGHNWMKSLRVGE
ncbi:nucleotidyltransferase domain-containing protein [Planococcus sp. CAU13]|uniref:nucleotidyltransferase domain-containing protein n=1 Tax=Planococcus sp. CAU13 TaxID=1541197 RepID=UPI00052FE776|nr:hypothetical protein [Planococcus sp. CAU13]